MPRMVICIHNRPHHCHWTVEVVGAACLRASGIALAVLISIAGCSVGPDYQPPKMKVSESYFAPSSRAAKGGGPTTRPTQINEQAARVTQWWALFNDPILDAMIDEAIASKLDLRLAHARVR